MEIIKMMCQTADKIAELVAHAKTRVEFNGDRLDYAKALFLEASKGPYISRGFYFDLARACMNFAGNPREIPRNQWGLENMIKQLEAAKKG